MRIVIQRVKRASVKVNQKVTGSISKGYLIFVGFGADDTDKDIDQCVDKIIHLRIMADENNKMNKSILDTKGSLLVISQFTLYANLSGRRPDFISAMKPTEAEKMYNNFIEQIKKQGIHVEQGEFGAMMEVELVNDGPVTIVFDTNKDI